MLRVGITGGIGSGKSTVCQVFETLGIPVFYADGAAKYLMENDASLIGSIKQLFGEGIYSEGRLDRERLAAMVFRSEGRLRELNAAVHPATIRYAKDWMDTQQAPYAIKEAAIFFESGSDKDVDLMIGVSAPEMLRVLRTIQRDHTNEGKVRERMSQQMNEEEKMGRCNYIITNDDIAPVIPQVMNIHRELLARSLK